MTVFPMPSSARVARATACELIVEFALGSCSRSRFVLREGGFLPRG